MFVWFGFELSIMPARSSSSSCSRRLRPEVQELELTA